MDDISIYCPYCHRHTALSIADGWASGNYKSGSSIFHNEHGTWFVGICNSCKKCVMGHYSPTRNLTIYPTPLPKPIDERTPNFIKSDMEEANRCLSISAHKATCSLARMILQNICLDKGANGGKRLQEQIDDLLKDSIITKDVRDWAHSVRYVGNDVLHPSKDSPKIEKDDAEEIMNLVEQMIHILYIAPAIAKEKQDKFRKK